MTSSPATIGVVTVTYNSDRYLDTYLSALGKQTLQPTAVVLVDSGSSDSMYLNKAEASGLPVKILRETNVGFAQGSNLGWDAVREMDFILFLNPDAFPEPDFLEKAVAFLKSEPAVGMLTPTLLRFDIGTGQPLGIVDTTGVVRNRFGLFVERDSEQPVSTLKKYDGPNDVPWLCAAAMLARREALESVVESGANGKRQLFDESFFMYKEDTDLAWRVRRAGWRLVHHPSLIGYHCRGWQDRKKMPRQLRLMSARNEIRMSIKNHSALMVLALMKYGLVWAFDC